MKSTETIPIGDAAALFGLETHVLRHWEDVGLLHPARDPAGRRRYGRADVNRIAVAVRGKAAGLGLEEIAAILGADPTTRAALLARHHAELERRIEAIRSSQRLTQHVLDCRHGDFLTCPSFDALVDEVVAEASTTGR